MTAPSAAPTPSIRCFRCVACDAEYEHPCFTGCERCLRQGLRANLIPVYQPDHRDAAEIKSTWLYSRSPGIWRFSDRLPPIAPQYQISLGEGGTPLLPLRRLGKALGQPELHLKDESRNPTWSWKDRLMAAAVSAGLAAGAKAVAGSSTGNAGGSLAAYAARAGMPAYVFATEPVPDAMRALMLSYGAQVYLVAMREHRFTLLQEGIAERGWFPVTNLSSAPPLGSNLFGIEGYKTLAFEIALDLEFKVPDFVVVPTSYGDGLSGVTRGFEELRELGLCDRLPTMIAVRPVEPNSVAFSLGRPAESFQVTRALRATGGRTCYVPEDQIMAMQLRLASTEGLYLEAASVVGLCALAQLELPREAFVVAVGTSSGLKDPATTLAHLPALPRAVPGEVPRLSTLIPPVPKRS